MLVRVTHLWSTGCVFNSWLLYYQAATLDKLVSHMPGASVVTTVWGYRSSANLITLHDKLTVTLVFATGGRAGGWCASVTYHDNSKLCASIFTSR